MSDEKSSGMGPFKRFLIHLAGAEPSVFSKLGSNGKSEASEFMKLGVTVLVPFILALTAGTFTLYTIQDEPKNMGVALIFGMVWALIILGMDVAIMSQLVKSVDLPPPETYTRAYGPRQTTPLRVKRNGLGRIMLPTLRIIIAATLGLVMSHCLVLAIFKGRVQQQMEQVRASMQKDVDVRFVTKIEADEKLLAEARRISNIVDRDTMYAGYQAFMKSQSGAADVPGPLPMPKGVTDSDDPILKRYIDAIRQCSEEANQRDGEKDNATMEISRLQGDNLQVKKMLRDEQNGIVTTYSFNSRYFQKLPIKVTTGKLGAGSHATIINEYLAGYEAELAKLRQDSVTAEANLNEANVLVQKAKDDYREAVKAQAVAAGKNADKIMAENDAAKKTVYSAAQEDIAKRAGEIEERLKRQRADYDVARSPVSGSSYDLMEQTEALHDLALGRNGASTGGSKQSVVLGLVMLILICLMFIDLTPLFMKLMRQPGAYERWKAMAAKGILPDDDLANGGGHEGGGGPTRGPQGPRPGRKVQPPPPYRPNGR